MRFREAVMGLRVYGIGHPDLEFNAPVTFAYGSIPGGAAWATWVSDGLDSLPEQGAASAYDELAGSYTTNPMTFGVALDETTSRALMAYGGARLGTLMAAVDVDDTTLELGTTGLTGIVCMGRETIKLGAESPSGTYSSCIRGYQDSPARTHAAGAYAYPSPVWWSGREVALIRSVYDPEALDWVESVEWQGRMTRAPRINEDATLIIVDADEILAPMASAQINRDAPDALEFGAFEVRRGVDFDVISGRLDGYVRRVCKNASARTIALQVEGALYVGYYLAVTGAESTTLDRARPELGSGPARLVEEETLARVPVESAVYELLVVDPDLDALYDADGGVSPTYRASYPYHPLTVALAVLTSTQSDAEDVDPLYADVLGSRWSYEVAQLDLDAWATAIQSTPHQRVRGLVWGWDGAPVGMTRVLELLRAWGWVLARRQGGSLRPVQAARPVSIVEAATAQTIEVVPITEGGTLSFDPGAGAPAAEVVGLVGARPWGVEALRVTVDVAGEGAAEEGFAPAAGFDLDLSTVDPDDALAWGAGIPQGAISTLTRYARALTWRIPYLRVRGEDPDALGIEYDLGSVYKLSGGPVDARIPLPDGTLTTFDADDVRLLGRLTESATDPRDGTRGLGLRLDAYRPGSLSRLRAPAGLVGALDSGTNTITIDSSEGFGTDGEPADLFEVGDQLQFVRADGGPVAEVIHTAEILSKNGADFVLDIWPFSPDPSLAGLIMRIASCDEYDNGARVAGYTRPFVHLADANGELTHDGDTITGDIYG